MALQIRRGTDTQRQALSGPNTPIAGELLYSTDNKKLHIGDGTTTGGTSIGYFGSVAVSGQSTIKSTGANEALTIVAGANISLTTNANTGTLTIAAAPQELTNGSLRLFQNNITSLNSNEDINIDPAGTGKVNVTGNLTATTLTGALTGNVTGNADSATVSSTVDITNTNGLTTVYYPTFVENRTTGQTFRADVDLTYRTDTNTLTAPAFSGNLTGNVTGVVTGSAGSSLVGNVTGNVTGNAGSVTNGVYTTDTSTVTNTMLAGSIANAKLLNSSLTIGSTAISLGSASTTISGLTSLTSTTLNSTNLNVSNIFSNQDISIDENRIRSLNSNQSIFLDPAGTGIVNVSAGLSTSGIQIFGPGTGGASGDGTILVVTQNSTALPLNILKIHNTGSTVTGGVNLGRARGSISVQTAVQNNDTINQFLFTGYDGTAYQPSSAITASVAGAVSSNLVPGKLDFSTSNASGNLVSRLSVSSTAVTSTVPISNGSLQLFQNNLTGLNSNEDIVIDPSGTGKLQVLGDLNVTGALKLAVYADATARDAAVTSPTAGMVVFNTTGTKFQGYTGSAWVDLN